MNKVCENFKSSRETQEVIKRFGIIGYCIKKKANIGKGGCDGCKENKNDVKKSKPRGLLEY